MPDSATETALDHSSDPNFQSFYLTQSVNPKLRAHFLRIRDRMLRMLSQQSPGQTQFKVLDVGCNAGTQAMLWAELGHEVHGLDVNAPLLQVARSRAQAAGLDIGYDLGTAARLPYADGSMDACLMLELLEHVPEWQDCLREAVRVMRPGGLLYLSTTNWLCPKQQEFDLPFYSWYPGPLKRHYERLATSSRPELVAHASYPAVNWFSFYALRRHLARLGLRSLDRFDLIEADTAGLPVRAAVWAVRNLAPLRLAGHMCTPGSALLAIKTTSAH